MNPIDLTLCQAAAAINRGELTAKAYAEALLARCRALEDLNAFITLDRDKVREKARAADRERTRGATLGPLHGVPLAIKDNFDVEGYPTTAGTPALRDHHPQRTAPAVAALRGAGAIVLADSNEGEHVFQTVARDGEIDDIAIFDRLSAVGNDPIVHAVNCNGEGRCACEQEIHV